MSNKACPMLVISAVITKNANENPKCVKELCACYDEHAQQCSQVSQAMALRDIAEQLKRNADAVLDYSPAKEPVEVELQSVKRKYCMDCKYELALTHKYPCSVCNVTQKDKWEPK